MVALDTNVLVRLLVRDDEAQFQSAYSLFHDQEVYIPDSVLLESEWVLRYAYEYPPESVCSAFRRVLGLKNVVVEDPTRIAKVLAWHVAGLDFADALHLAKSEHLPSFKTFDKSFVKRSRGLSVCKVSAP